MKEYVKWNQAKCFNCKHHYYMYANDNNTLFCDKSKRVNAYCSTENYKDRCKKFEPEFNYQKWYADKKLH